MRRSLSPIRAAARLQLQLIASDFNYLMPLATIPVLSAVFLSIVDHAQRPDVLANALFAPALIGMWGMALFVSGEIVSLDRSLGVLEQAVVAPASYVQGVFVRTLVVTTASLTVFVEVWLVARLFFDLRPTIYHPAIFAAALSLSALAMSGTALLMTALFVRLRNARLFQNSLSYPFYILGGVMVPVALLPDWVEPTSKVIFLSWGSDLLRDSLRSDPLEGALQRLAALALLTALGYAVGYLASRRMLERSRLEGDLGLW